MQSELQCQTTFDISTSIYNTLNELHNQAGVEDGFLTTLRVTEKM